MTERAENYKWYKEKGGVLAEYDAQTRAARIAVAGRGFLLAPGFLSSVLTTYEREAKLRLREINYQIVAEAIERELKQTGHDYDLTYKQARIDWELEKIGLLTALTQEFADIKATLAESEEALALLQVDQSLRKLILITAKTEIDIEKEGLKQGLAAVDRQTFDAETRLLNEKIITADAKLAVIPYIERLIIKEDELIAAERVNAGYQETYIDIRGDLAAKKEELIPRLMTKAEKQLELAIAIEAEIVIREQRLAVALSKMLLSRDKVDNALAIIDAKKEVEALRKLLVETQTAYSESQMSGRTELLQRVVANLTGPDGVLIKELTVANTIETYHEESASSARQAREHTTDEGLANDAGATQISVDAQVDSINQIANTHADQTKYTADFAAKAEITSNLIHLIGEV